MWSCAWAISMSTYLVKMTITPNCYSISLFSLRQLIDAPTRLTCNSATTLDPIFVIYFVSSNFNIVECRVSDAINVSDHLTIYTSYSAITSSCDRVSVSRNIHAIRPEDIELELIDWFPYMRCCRILMSLSFYGLFYCNLWPTRSDYL